MALTTGFFLRATQINESLWLDELHTSWVADGSLHDVLPRAQAGNQSPAYFYLVWGLVALWGQHEWVMRLPSLLAGMTLILVTGLLTFHWTKSRWAALLAVWLVTLDRECVFYAQEARPYALLQLAALLHGVVFVGVLCRPTRRRRVALILGAAALFYLHYTAFLFLAAELVCWILLVAQRNKHVVYRPRQLLVDIGFLGLLILPAGSHLIRVAARRAHWARLIGPWPSPALQFELISYVAIALLAILARHLFAAPRQAHEPRRILSIWIVLWWAVPLCLAWLSTVIGLAPLWMLRYLVATLVGMIIFAAWGVTTANRLAWRALLTLVILTACLIHGGMARQWYADGRVIGDRREDWATAVQWLNAHNRQTDRPVLLMAGLLEDAELVTDASPDLQAYCQFPLQGIYRVCAPVMALPSRGAVQLSDRQLQVARQQQGLWLVVRAGKAGTQRRVRAVQDALLKAKIPMHITLQRRFGGLAAIAFCSD